MSPDRVRAPLGVFDSGLGGLTVVRAISHLLPGESIVYFGDTARLPYGNKSKRTVTRLSLEALWFLQHFGVKAMVVACNSASALALDALVAESQVPVLGVVEAGARRAAASTRRGRVGVIGTRATVASKCYERALTALEPELEVTAAACPLFVPLVEEGWIDHAVTRSVAEEYLAPLREAGVDALILGCTHYPLLKDVLRRVMGDDVVLIDSGEAVAGELQDELEKRGLASSSPESAPAHRFFVSEQAERFHEEGRRFLGEILLGSVETVDQSDVPWYDRRSALGAANKGGGIP
jgi:glutamate racemase